MSNPQEVQFGSQPPTNADVSFGKVPATGEVATSTVGEDAPAASAESAPDATEPGPADADTSDAPDAPEDAAEA